MGIRSGNSVIVIDVCGPKAAPTEKWPLSVKVYGDKQLTDGTDIYRAMDGKMFKVRLSVII